jgi:hypothetical protein
VTPKVNWKEAKGNAFMQALRIEMLTDRGCMIFKQCKLQTDTNDAEPEWRNVVYDRDFVIAKLANMIAPLQSLGWNDLMKLLKDAWNLNKQQMKS